MADLGEMLAADAAEDPRPVSRRRRRLLSETEAEEFVERCLEQVDEIKDSRADWLEKRLARAAKQRGWLPREDGPWDDASDQHIPIIQSNCLRVHAAFHNAVLGNRPVVFGKPLRPEHRERAEKNDFLLDHQMFVDQEGERNIERAIIQFVDEGTLISFQPRVLETKGFYDVHRFPVPLEPLAEAVPELIAEVASEFSVQFSMLTRKDDEGRRWDCEYVDMSEKPSVCVVEVYDVEVDGQDLIELVFNWRTTVFDGPAMIPLDLEDVLVPIRSENLQPVSGANPGGAPYVIKVSKVDADTVRRRIKSGDFDYLTMEDLEPETDSEETRGGKERTEDFDEGSHDEKAITAYKESQAGLEPLTRSSTGAREWYTIFEWYGGHDCNDDQLNEEVVFTVVAELRKLARAKYLTELYPGIPERRPFAEGRFISVPGQFYGIGLPELMEGLSDFIHVLLNENVDAARIANMPWFGYRAASGFKPDKLRLGPGDGIPLDDVQRDLAFYNIPHSDQSWGFNMIGLAMQFVERLTQMGAMQFGQVPQGKASALRTVGTTMAILQQSAAMPEQILRRLFCWLRDVYAQFHLINCRFLPPNKRYLVTGRPLSNDDAYMKLNDRRDIAIPLSFDFQATLLNSNKGLVSEALASIGSALFSPLAFQSGLVTPEELYNWAHDLVRANQLEPGRYLRRPPGVTDEPKITVEEALLDITSGIMPQSVNFVYPATEALQKFVAFVQSDDVGLLTEPQVAILKAYLMAVQQKAQQEMQAMQQAQAAAAFQQTLGGGKGEAGRPPEMGEAPPMQPEMGTATEAQGAAQGSGSPML